MTNEHPTWSDTESPKRLKDALERKDHGEAGELLDLLCCDLDKTGRLVDSKTAKEVLTLLRKYAWFDKLNQVAEKFKEHAQDDPQVLLELAQARIELNQITPAVEGLLDLKEQLVERLADSALGPNAEEKKRLEDELGKTMGLLGRSYKQYYINAKPSRKVPREHDLKKALQYYRYAYDKGIGDFRWHGINCVALLNHRERVAKKRPNVISREAKGIAQEILEAINKKPSEQYRLWDFANRIEANLAIGNTTGAIEATEEYLDKADAFNVQSTRRQLMEIWMLDENHPPGTEILPMMNARFAELGGTLEAVELNLTQAENYEKVWDKTNYKSLKWLNNALARAKSVARIGPNKYDGDGTGFLFDGAWIGDQWAGKPLLLTNAHVCSNDPVVQNQYPYPPPPEELTAAFLGSGGAGEAAELKFCELIWTSKPSKLDATLLLLESVPDGCTPPPLTNRRPPVTVKGDARLNILGHPKGLDLRISLQDNKIIDVGEKYVHYRTPTDPGSSGSPVFNQKWELVALHHAASTKKQANEGVRMDVIINAISSAFE